MGILSYPGDSVALTFLLRCSQSLTLYHQYGNMDITEQPLLTHCSAGPSLLINDWSCQNKINQPHSVSQDQNE